MMTRSSLLWLKKCKPLSGNIEIMDIRVGYSRGTTLFGSRRCRTASSGNATFIVEPKWRMRMEVRRMSACCSTGLRSSTLLFRRDSMSGTRTLAACSVQAFISQNIRPKVTNMFME
uniref:Uncharacterized protein n=1 Tax=Cacopsylla melanoneura TaxID=428564 RepID=A0A8D8LV45_9HEMI